MTSGSPVEPKSAEMKRAPAAGDLAAVSGHSSACAALIRVGAHVNACDAGQP